MTIQLTSKRQYPTKEQILEEPMKYKKGIMPLMKEWKIKTWYPAKRGDDDKRKFDAIEIMLKKLANFYDKPLQNVNFLPQMSSCCYSPPDQTITINETVSIISALHEFAHHLYGDSELKACRWSVHLFKDIFPKAFAKLQWQKHMLVK